MTDEIAYAFFLIFSVASGFCIQRLPSAKSRKLICGSIGVCSSAIFCKYDFMYGLVSSVICALLCCANIRIINYYRRSLLFFWGFAFLTFFRVAHIVGLPPPCPLANAVQLVLTLKIVGIGGEIADSQQRRKQQSQEKEKPISDHSADFIASNPQDNFVLQCLYRNVHPSFTDVLCYLYSYAGMFTGPYYSYRTWNDAMEGIYTAKSGFCSISNYCNKTMISLLLQTALCGVLYFVLIKLFPLDHLWSMDWSMSSVVYRLLYLIPVFSWYRLRFYSAWLASESALASLRIGVYPTIARPEPGAGPTDLVALHKAIATSDSSDEKKAPTTGCHCESKDGCSFWSTEAVHNISIYECEFSPTVAGKLRAWNRTVQYWLAVHSYQRLPRSLPRPLRAFITVFVSAYWHGLHAGYYLSFGTAGALLSAERVLPRLFSFVRAYSPFQKSIPRSPEKDKSEMVWLDKMRSFISSYMAGFWSMRVFEYMAVGFYVLSFSDTTRIWLDVMYVHHVIAALLLLASLVLPRSEIRPE